MRSRPLALARRIVLVAGLLVGPGVVVTAAPAQAAYVPSAATTAAYEARVIYQINAQRVRYARGKLAASTCPDRSSGAAASRFSQEFAAIGFAAVPTSM